MAPVETTGDANAIDSGAHILLALSQGGSRAAQPQGSAPWPEQMDAKQIGDPAPVVNGSKDLEVIWDLNEEAGFFSRIRGARLNKRQLCKAEDPGVPPPTTKMRKVGVKVRGVRPFDDKHPWREGGSIRYVPLDLSPLGGQNTNHSSFTRLRASLRRSAPRQKTALDTPPIAPLEQKGDWLCFPGPGRTEREKKKGSDGAVADAFFDWIKDVEALEFAAEFKALIRPVVAEIR
jgi:hypothetical protein